jgi:hypothetical protein
MVTAPKEVVPARLKLRCCEVEDFPLAAFGLVTGPAPGACRSSDAEFLHARAERARLEPEHCGGVPAPVDPPPAALEHAQDVLPFDLVQTIRGAPRRGLRVSGAPLTQPERLLRSAVATETRI